MKNLIIVSLFLPAIALADYTIDMPPQNIKDLKYPKSGVEIVPASQIPIPEVIKKDLESNLRQIKEKGYFESKAPDAEMLLSMKGVDVVAMQNKGLTTLNDPKDSHMKDSISRVGLAFFYPGIASVASKDVIGYAGVGMWVDDKNGWSGIKEFFNDDKLGTCSFTLYNMTLSHGNVKISDDTVNYDVNKKPGTSEAHGINVGGYAYYVSWYDNTFIHELDCASAHFDKEMLHKMTVFANVVDKDLSIKLKY